MTRSSNNFRFSYGVCFFVLPLKYSYAFRHFTMEGNIIQLDALQHIRSSSFHIANNRVIVISLPLPQANVQPVHFELYFVVRKLRGKSKLTCLNRFAEVLY